MKKLIVIVAIILSVSKIYAQQEAMYSQYMFNTMAVNPAYAGSREVLSVTALSRVQWVGFEGAPNSQTMSVDMPFANKKVGVGIQAFCDRLGIMSNSGVYGSYAYRIKFEKSTLAFGLQGGLVNFSANYKKVKLGEMTVTDRAFATDVNAWIPSAGAGVYMSSDKYYVGASLPNLFNTELSNSSNVQVNKFNHLFLMGGYVFPLNNDFKLKPSALIKAVKGAPVEMDINMNLWMYDVLAVGVSYRTGDAAVAMVEIQLAPNFKLGYAFDYTLTSLQQFNSGSHELMLRYEFGYTKDKILTPRYF